MFYKLIVLFFDIELSKDFLIVLNCSCFIVYNKYNK